MKRRILAMMMAVLMIAQNSLAVMAAEPDVTGGEMLLLEEEKDVLEAPAPEESDQDVISEAEPAVLEGALSDSDQADTLADDGDLLVMEDDEEAEEAQEKDAKPAEGEDLLLSFDEDLAPEENIPSEEQADSEVAAQDEDELALEEKEAAELPTEESPEEDDLLLLAEEEAPALLAGGMEAGEESWPPEATLIYLDQEYPVSLDEEVTWRYFAYTPDRSGRYIFYSFSDEYQDFYGHLYDADGNELTSDDDSNGNGSFRIEYLLSSGTTYYLGVRAYSLGNDIMGMVSVTEDTSFTVDAKEGNVSVAPGMTKTLEVIYSSVLGSPTFTWYREYEDEPISGATENTLTVDDSYQGYYYCQVEWDGNSESVWFYVYVDNELRVDYESSHTTTPGGDVTLTVNATVQTGSISYEWSVYDSEAEEYTLIDGETASELTLTNVMEPQQVRCIVRDDFEAAQECYFEIGIDNRLVIEEYEEHRTVVPETVETLSVTASCLAGEIRYQWARLSQDSWDYEDIEGETGSGLVTAPITGYEDYRCRVSDDYGNEEYCHFIFAVDNELDAEYESAVKVMAGSDATLTVNASAAVGSLSYAWYDQDWNEIAGENGNTLTVPNVTGPTQRHCQVRDEYNSQMDCDFYITVDSGLEVSYESGYETIPGQTVTLPVNASVSYGSVHYRWYHYSEDDYNWVELEGTTGSSLVTEPITRYSQYLCEVSDDYGNSDSCHFYINVDNQWNIDYNSDYKVVAGEDAVLTVNASVAAGSLSYTWYDDQWQEIAGENGSTLTVPNVTGRMERRCTVRDEYGESRDCHFYISVDNELNVKWESDVYVLPEETATLFVNATVLAGEISYKWYKYSSDTWNWEEIPGATGSSIETDPVTESEMDYYCHVEDDYGNAQDCSFDVYMDNQWDVDYESSYLVDAGDDVTLSVDASVGVGSISYEWQIYDPHSDEWKTADGETGSSFTLTNVLSYTQVYCRLTDDYGNSYRCDINVRVDNQFSVDHESSVYAAPQEQAVLTVNATVLTGDITYRWYDADTYEQIPGETGSVYTTPPVTGYKSYYCYVEDIYGNNTNCWFYVYLDNQWEVHYTGDVTVEAGEDATLSVDASVAYGSLIYTWYDENWNEITGENESTLTIPDVTGYTCRYCYVRDEYGGSYECDFRIRVNSGLTVSYDREITVAPGETVPLTVTAQVKSGEISYRWYRYDDFEDEWVEIPGAAGNTYTAGPLTENKDYYCKVSDDYGYSVDCNFEIYVDNQWRVSYEPYYTADTDGNVTLAVNASAAAGEITYQWYLLDAETDTFNQIAGETGSSLTVSGLTDSTEAKCVAANEYSGEKECYFYIFTQNAERADWAEGRPRVIELRPGREYGASVDENTYYRYFSFTPDHTDMYTFYSFGNDGDTYGYLYDFDGNEIARDDDGGGGRNFLITSLLEAGEKYYFGASALNTGDRVIFKVKLEVADYTAIARESNVRVRSDEEATLEVLTKGIETPTFEWYRGEPSSATRIEGASLSTLTVSPADGNAYCCIVRWSGNRETIYFTLKVDNELYAEGGGDIYVQPNETADLAVTASAAAGELHYRWFEYSIDEDRWIELPGISGNAMTTEPITSLKEYYCLVEDDFGNEEECDFDIHVDNQLRVTYNNHVTAVPGQPAVLSVTATAIAGEITYRWYDEDTDELISGAAGPEYTIPSVTRQRYIRCRVEDEYGNYRNCYFDVCPDNEWRVEYISDYLVSPGEDVTLSIDASVASGSLTYTWYDDNGNRIDGESGSSLTLTDVTTYTVRSCTIRDEYGTGRSCDFYIHIENQFAVDYDSEVYVTPGQQAVLSVVATTASGDVTYQWYDNNTGEMIPGATEASYTTAPVTENKNYYCHVEDPYGNYQNCPVNVILNNDWSVEYTSDYAVSAGDDVTLSVNASVAAGSLAYNWYDEDGNRISGETGPSLTLTNVTKYTRIRCTISDEYNASRNCYFYIRVENQFSVSYEDFVSVLPGQQAVLTVTATAASGDVTYQWYDADRDVIIPGATGSSYTTPPLTSSWDYRCHVEDQYGNSENCWFEAIVNNQWQLNYESEYAVAPGEDVTLSVEASVAVGSLTYTWYDEDNEIIPGETGSSLTLTDVTQRRRLYCIVRDEFGESRQVAFDVYIENGFDVDWDTEVYVDPGQPAVLSVTAQAALGEITYEWYQYLGEDYVKISGADGPSYTTDPVNEPRTFHCDVTDQYGNRCTCTFDVYINSGLTVDYISEHTVEYGSDVVLTVDAAVNYGSVTYRWYNESGNWISGAAGNTLTRQNVIRHQEVSCVVSDDYGNSEVCYFSISIDNQFTVSYESTAYAAPGKSAQLSVTASARTGDIKYTWYKYSFVESCEDYRWVQLYEESGPTLTTDPIYYDTRYRCVVQDIYQNQKDCYFYVYPGAEWTLDYESEHTVLPGGDVTLEVDATVTAGDIDYEWAVLDKDSDEWITVPGQTLDSYTLTNVQSRTQVRCTMQDDFSGIKTAYFQISIENQFDVTWDEMVTVEPGVPAQLVVNASVHSGDIHYRWIRQDNEVSHTEFPEVTGNTMIIDPVERWGHYICIVSDDYDNRQACSFYVRVDNHFSVDPETDTVYVEFGKSAGLEVSASGTVDGFTYQWLVQDPSGAMSEISGAVSPALTTDSLTRDTRFMCQVFDSFGNFARSEFEVKICREHVPVTDPAVAVTCETDGLTEGSHCSRCGKVITAQEVIPATGHTVVTDPGKAATCEEDGLTEGSHCSVCSKVLVEQTVIPATGHTVVVDPGKAATCEEDGLTEGSHCSVCSKVLVEQTVIPATGHTTVVDAAVPATCEEEGKTEGSHCSKCGKVFVAQEVIPALGHDPVTDAAVAATCEKPGKTEGSHCSRCGKVFTAQEVIPATGHDFTDWTVVKEATAVETGLKERTCRRCSKKEEEILPKLTPTITLSAEEVTLTIPASQTIEVSGLALGDAVDHWSSADEAIASVSNGTITAKKAGTTTVTVTLKSGLTGNVKVTVKSNMVKPVMNAVFNSAKGGDIRWKAVPDCVGYKVYRQRSSEGIKLVATINDPATLQCIDPSIKDNCWGCVYHYYVTALYNEGGKTVEGPKSDKLVLQRLAPMKITKLTNSAKSTVSLTWACTVNANKALGYEIQYAESSADLYNRKGTFKAVAVDGRNNLSTTIKKLTKGKTYWFRVRCYVNYTHSITHETTKTWSQYSSVVSVKITK